MVLHQRLSALVGFTHSIKEPVMDACALEIRFHGMMVEQVSLQLSQVFIYATSMVLLRYSG